VILDATYEIRAQPEGGSIVWFSASDLWVIFWSPLHYHDTPVFPYPESSTGMPLNYVYILHIHGSTGNRRYIASSIDTFELLHTCSLGSL
jgi:hypothetical protein